MPTRQRGSKPPYLSCESESGTYPSVLHRGGRWQLLLPILVVSIRAVVSGSALKMHMLTIAYPDGSFTTCAKEPIISRTSVIKGSLLSCWAELARRITNVVIFGAYGRSRSRHIIFGTAQSAHFSNSEEEIGLDK